MTLLSESAITGRIGRWTREVARLERRLASVGRRETRPYMIARVANELTMAREHLRTLEDRQFIIDYERETGEPW